MNIADLQSFLAVVELHSISLAAKKMHITQPALSKRIKKMEEEWNTQLFISSGIRTELTPKGKQLLPYVRQMIHLNDEMIKNTTRDAKHPQLLINLGASVYIANSIIPHLILDMSSLDLNYFVNTKLIADKDILHGLKEGSYDVIISPGDGNNSAEITSIPLWQEGIIPVVGINHPLASTKKKISFADLATHEAVLMEKSFLIRKIINKRVEQQKLSLKIISETNTIYNNIALVEKGMGWSMIFERLLNSHLIPLKLSDYSPTIDFHCYCLKKRMDDRLIRVFIDHLRNWVSTSNDLCNYALSNKNTSETP